MRPHLQSMEVDTRTECNVWVKTAAQVVPCALVHCHDEFVMHQTCHFLVIYGVLHHGDASALPNKNSNLQFCLVKCNHGAQHLDQTK